MCQIIDQGLGIRTGRFIANQYFITSKPVLTGRHHIPKFLESLPGVSNLKTLELLPSRVFTSASSNQHSILDSIMA
jgi:hypothetical protein